MMTNGLIAPLFFIGFAALLLIGRNWYAKKYHKGEAPIWLDAAMGLLLLLVTGLLEYSMGRTPTYKYGGVSLWSGDIWSNQNSQQVADPYTFTHVLHGLIFYAILQLVAKKLLTSTKFFIAFAAECAWEIFENTDLVVNHYRAVTISLDYFGDSIINSIFDVAAMAIGFLAAAKMRIAYSVALFFVVEAALLLTIRDTLILNIIMLIAPIDAIKNWQMQGMPQNI